jgi:uncharacterized protein YbjT (DUF2867 family)
MKIIVAGGSGFVGQALVRGLMDDGHEVTVLQRTTSKSISPKIEKLRVVYINPERPFTDINLTGDAIINLVGIIREFPSKNVTFHGSHFMVTKNLVDHARENGIKRFLQMSALGAEQKAQTKYMQTKYEAELYLKESGLSWTIFRPSVIFGPGDHLITMLANMIRRLPFVPVIGDGQYKIQPVHVNDVCVGFRKSLVDERTVGRTFEIGGPEVFMFNQMLDIIGEVIDVRKVRKVNQPLWCMRLMAGAFSGFSWFPVTNEQIKMLLEDNLTDDKSYWELLGITPRRFRESLKEYLK